MPQRPRPTRSNRVAVEETSVDDVLKAAEGINFGDETAVKTFEDKHRARLWKGGEDSQGSSAQAEDEVLHVIAEKSKLLNEHKAFLEWVIKAHTPLFQCKSMNGGGETPLHRAIRKKNHEFVQIVVDKVEAEVLLKHSTDLGESCLHYAIRYLSPFTELIICMASDFSRKATERINIDGIKSYYSPFARPVQLDVFKAKTMADGFKKMTPLHMAVFMDDDDPDSDSMTSVAQGNPSFKLPNPKHENSEKINAAAHTPEKSEANIKARRPSTVPEESKTIQEDREPMDGLSFFRKARAFDRQRIVKQLIEAAPRVLVDCEDEWSDTPFRARLDGKMNGCEDVKPNTAAENEPEESFRHNTIENDPILLYMRKYIIEKFSRRDAMTALYRLGDERVLEFDLTGLPHSTINTDFMKGLGQVLRFEGLLKYVALPSLTVEDDDSLGPTERKSNEAGENTVQDGVNISQNETSDTQNEASKTKGKGIQNMCPIFTWLKSCNVKSVLTVTVVDNVEPSHSDEAIEACMSKLDVQFWNWYKIDLCCDVILNSAKLAKDVTLYSSGNNAVLVGWSSLAGLPKLEELERVHIFVQEGLERPSRLKQYMNTFKEALGHNHKRPVAFSWGLLKSEPNYNSVFNNRGSEKSGSESKWMKSMMDFADLLKMARKDKSAEPVKIAIIDDGINMALSTFAENVKGGESFYHLSELSGRRGAYYAPNGPHGTLMAQLICDVCPVADLYIAQLELLPGQNGQRSFTAESATEAIKWAINRNVDIISMSWSINTSRDLSRLNAALQQATREKIILFCASIDEGATTHDNTYPGNWKSCIKIGACTGTGAKLSWVSESHSNYLLPGEVPKSTSEPNLWNSPHMGSFGSSVSTALAAGLAGVLLYCDRLIETRKVDPEPDPSEREGGNRSQDLKKVDYLRNMSNMDTAFKKLSMGTEYNKFPQVWDSLPRDLKWSQKSWPEETEKAKETLGEFMRRLKT